MHLIPIFFTTESLQLIMEHSSLNYTILKAETRKLLSLKKFTLFSALNAIIKDGFIYHATENKGTVRKSYWPHKYKKKIPLNVCDTLNKNSQQNTEIILNLSSIY